MSWVRSLSLGTAAALAGNMGWPKLAIHMSSSDCRSPWGVRHARDWPVRPQLAQRPCLQRRRQRRTVREDRRDGHRHHEARRRARTARRSSATTSARCSSTSSSTASPRWCPIRSQPVQTIVWRDGKTRITTDNAYLEISNRVQVRFTDEIAERQHCTLAGHAGGRATPRRRSASAAPSSSSKAG